VPKKDLVGAVQALVGPDKLKISPALPEGAILRKELSTFRVKVTVSNNETYEAWPEGDKDDLVLACAFCCWGARWITGHWEATRATSVRTGKSVLSTAPRSAPSGVL
jgi:hypothetical protein